MKVWSFNVSLLHYQISKLPILFGTDFKIQQNNDSIQMYKWKVKARSTLQAGCGHSFLQKEEK